jgi:aspartate aminotransferase
MTSQRVNNIGESATLKIGNQVAKMRKDGVDVVSFSAGEPDFDTPGHIIEAAKNALDTGKTHYTPSYGIPELREAIADKSKADNGIPCSAGNVLVTPAKFSIYAAAQSLVDKGDEVIVPNPGWVSYIPITQFAEGVPVEVNFDAENTIEQLKGAITQKTKLLIFNSPSNPTGKVLTADIIKGIADLAADHDFYVLSDEIYEKIIYDGKHVSIAAMPGMFERCITINGFSKAYAMTGWRLGWAVAPESILKGMNKVQSHTVTCCTAFAQHGGVDALRGSQQPVGDMLVHFRRRRELIMKELDAIAAFSYSAPEGAFYIFPRFDTAKLGIGSAELAEKLLMDGHVAVTPGVAFGSNGEGHLRLSYATSEDNIKEGLGRIREVMGSL